MNEHDKVIIFIVKDLGSKYKVTENLGTDKKWHIRGIFPDVIVISKENNAVMFVIEVETNDSLVSSVSQWKNYIDLPGTFYIIVPKGKLNDAKSLAAASGIKAKFGFYEYINNEVTSVHYDS